MKIRSVLLLLLIGILFSCEQSATPSHVHAFSESWSNNETHHWHQATCEHTDLFSDYSEHDFEESEITQLSYTEENIKYKCKICGYEKNERRQQEHDISIWVSEIGWVNNNRFITYKSALIYIDCVKSSFREAFNGNNLEYYYTLDGTEPTKESHFLLPSSKNYLRCEFVLEESCTLKIFASMGVETTSIETFEITVIPRVPKPIISTENDCKFMGAGESITITCSLEDAKIYYSLDGSIPSETSNLYTGPFYIYQNCTIYAIAMKPDYLQSQITSLIAQDRFSPSNPNISMDHISDTSIKINIEKPSEPDYDGCTLILGDVTKTIDKNSNFCIFEDLNPFQKYEIKIQAFDILGNINSSSLHSFLTYKSAKPTEQGLVIIRNNDYSIIPHITINKQDNYEDWIELFCYVTSPYEISWYHSSDNITWTKISDTDNFRDLGSGFVNIKVSNGINYYCAGIKDYDTIVFSNSCKINCNTSISSNLGKIYYSDGTVSSDFIEGKEVLGIVCNVKKDGSIKNVLSLTEESISFYYLLRDNNYSVIDGLKNTNNLHSEDPRYALYLNERINKNRFIPSMQEIQEAICNHEIIDNSLKLLKTKGMDISLINDNLEDESKCYWSSSTSSFNTFGAWGVTYFIYHESLNWFYEGGSFCYSSDNNIIRTMYRIN